MKPPVWYGRVTRSGTVVGVEIDANGRRSEFVVSRSIADEPDPRRPAHLVGEDGQ